MDQYLLSTALLFHGIRPEMISLIELSLLITTLLFFFHYFQQWGVTAFMMLAVLIGNIQILTECQFSFGEIPLGTLAFSCAFLSTTLLNEHYGKRLATKAVFMTFLGQIFFGMMMFITMAYHPTPTSQKTFNAITTLFSTSLRFFSASLLSYLFAQLFEIYVLNQLKDKLKTRFLFMRFNLAVWASGLLDNTIFSFLAFYLFTSDPVPLQTLVTQYIFATYWIRMLIGFLETPTIYLSYYLKSNS